MRARMLILVCNAHLDPVWLWQWQEGLGEALATFRAAAQLCEEFDGFAFCHNEAVLYQWVEEYEPELFEEIQELVQQKKWHIMGGWYLQPDCNLPSGESLVRQVLVGRRYFKEKFDAEPMVAVNVDSFGHSRGLVQILAKSGYQGYLFCRPDGTHLEVPGDDFVWVGYDGSEVLAHRAAEHYNSQRCQAGRKIRCWIEKNSGGDVGLLLWGIGNHGGGPSREDLQQIADMQREEVEWDIRHGTPEAYFGWLEPKKATLGRVASDLNPWAVGCYTSMARVKQRHRQLENDYYLTEKMVTNAALQDLMTYPGDKLRLALEDLMFCEFHDVLPGSSIGEVEDDAVRRMDHGMEILSRLRTQAFFAMAAGQEPAGEGEFPLLVYNPHPFDINDTVVCEFQPLEPNANRDVFLMPEVTDSAGNGVPFQLEKESCNIQVDQRKRVVFRAKLKAASMHRFSCYLKEVDAGNKPSVRQVSQSGFVSDECEVVVNPVTGLMDRYRVGGVDFLKYQPIRLLVMQDTPDPWGMKVRGFRDMEGGFGLMSDRDSAAFAGVGAGELASIRVIEDGAVRSVVEALFQYHHSTACIRYKIPKVGSEIEIEIRVYWNEKDRMLKLAIPTCLRDGRCRGQVAYGVQEFDRYGEELVAQKWVAVVSKDGEQAITVINDRTYGFDFNQGELRLSLLRSAAYAGHPVDGTPIVRQDRFEPRIDQGEHVFRFWVNAGRAEERLARVDREAVVKNEPPIALCCYPSGDGRKVHPGVRLSDDVVQVGALKMAEDGDWLIIRLYEPTGNARETRVSVPALDLGFDVGLGAFEIKTMGVDIWSREVFDLDLLEQKRRKS
jgi:alpha-mannosidase